MPLAGAGAKPSNRLRSTDWLIGMCRSAGGQRYFKQDFQLILVLASWVLFVPFFFVNIFAHVFARYGEFYLYTTASPHKTYHKSSQPEEGRTGDWHFQIISRCPLVKAASSAVKRNSN
jgi:hypothetical protein